jgi:biopolymer transport protein ExbD
MPRRLRAVKGENTLGFNLTPLIDVSFQLIIFFLLVSGIAGHESSPMRLPAVPEARLSNLPEHDRLFLNLLAKEDHSGQAARLESVQIGLESFAPHQREEMVRTLERARLENPSLHVLLRSPANLSFAQVSPILAVARDAGIERLAVVATESLRGSHGR